LYDSQFRQPAPQEEVMHAHRHLAVRTTATTVGAVALSLALSATPAAASGRDLVRAKGPLRDFATTAAGPFDHARGEARIERRGVGSRVTFRVRGIDRSVIGQDFGAHLHLGPCVTDNGAAALAHYNTDVIDGRTPPVVDETTEVWLDFSVSRHGKGRAIARVPFVPAAGQRSIVIHAQPTDSHGAAGARLACLPVEW
jgi:Cu/Zn superoxide dismutase